MTLSSSVHAEFMLSRSGGPRSRKPYTGLQTTGRPAACLAVVATLLVTWLSLSQLAQLISPLEKVSPGEVIRASGWHSVIDGTERNIESHLPRWRGTDVQLHSTETAPGALLDPASDGQIFTTSPNEAMHTGGLEASRPQVISKPTAVAARSKDDAATRPAPAQCNIAPHTE